MAKLDDLLHERSLHSVRSDSSQMIALATGQNQTDSEWEILIVRKDGSVENDGMLTLETGEKTVLRKVCNTERLQKLAALHDFVEWRPGVLEEHPDEQTITLQDQLQQKEHDLQEIKTQHDATEKQLSEDLKQKEQELQEAQRHDEATNKQLQETIQNLNKVNTAQRRKERVAASPSIDDLKSIASSIAERTPSETQKIIANQVELGSAFYQEVGVQSHESFRLSVWLAAAGGGIFF